MEESVATHFFFKSWLGLKIPTPDPKIPWWKSRILIIICTFSLEYENAYGLLSFLWKPHV